MIMDERTEFADAVSVAAAAGTALIGDVIDSGAIARDLGQGQQLFLVITTAVAMVSTVGAGTIKFQLVSDAQAAIATDGTASVHHDTGTFATAVGSSAYPLRAGDVIAVVPLPVGGRVYERYLGVLAVIATNAVGTGAINAFLTLDPPHTGRVYPRGDN